MKTLVLSLFVVVLGGCTCSRRCAAPPPGEINHVVMIKLQDPHDTDELLDDCVLFLGTIPGVKRFYAGRHFEMGRPNIDSDYDVGTFVAFNSEEAYEGYLEHPYHIHLVEKWRSRWEWIRIYDVADVR